MTDNEIGSERHRFCPSCGAEAVTGGSFCGECGRSLIETPVPSGQSVPGHIEGTDSATASNTMVSSNEVASVKKTRKWLWPVGATVVLLVIAGIILGVSSDKGGTTAPGESAADALGHKLYQENADVGLAENTCTTQADEQNAMTVTAFVNDCINAYVNGGGTTGSTGNTGNSGATGASGDSGTGGTGNTVNTTTRATIPPTTTTTIPPTTTTTIPPTTTTTISPQAAYQSGYQAGQATFKGDSPSQIQKYCTDLLTSYVTPISEDPALAAQFMAGCVAGEAS